MCGAFSADGDTATVTFAARGRAPGTGATRAQKSDRERDQRPRRGTEALSGAGGRMRFVSSGGRGSTFTVVVERRAVRSAGMQPAASAHARAAARPIAREDFMATSSPDERARCVPARFAATPRDSVARPRQLLQLGTHVRHRRPTFFAVRLRAA